MRAGPAWWKTAIKIGAPFFVERDHRHAATRSFGSPGVNARAWFAHALSGFIAVRLRLRFSITKRARLVKAHVRRSCSRRLCNQSHWQPPPAARRVTGTIFKKISDARLGLMRQQPALPPHDPMQVHVELMGRLFTSRLP